ncbi:MAG: energy transducer TonB [Reyranellales bacterium]
MAHAPSASSLRFNHMSPPALALAMLLHGLAALALWWMAQHPPQLPPPEVPIEVTVEQLKPPPPPPPPPRPPKEQAPAPSVRLGLPPPAAITADKPSQAPSTAERAQEALAPRPPSLEQVVPPPSQPPQPPETAFELPKAVLPPPARPTPPPPQRQLPVLPSPLRTAPQRQPPAIARAETPAPSPFVNPADTLNRARVADNYLWQIAAKLSGYRYKARAPVEEGVTVVRITIARDGRLLAIDVTQSSGFPVLDNGVVAGIRSGSPYAPLPPEIQGDRATFTLPLVSTYRP